MRTVGVRGGGQARANTFRTPGTACRRRMHSLRLLSQTQWGRGRSVRSTPRKAARAPGPDRRRNDIRAAHHVCGPQPARSAGRVNEQAHHPSPASGGSILGAVPSGHTGIGLANRPPRRPGSAVGLPTFRCNHWRIGPGRSSSRNATTSPSGRGRRRCYGGAGQGPRLRCCGQGPSPASKAPLRAAPEVLVVVDDPAATSCRRLRVCSVSDFNRVDECRPSAARCSSQITTDGRDHSTTGSSSASVKTGVNPACSGGGSATIVPQHP